MVFLKSLKLKSFKLFFYIKVCFTKKRINNQAVKLYDSIDLAAVAPSLQKY